MKIFKSSGGVTSASNGSSRSFISIKGLQTQSASGCGLILITEVNYKKSDIVIPIAASDDIRIAFLFGKAFSDVEIKGILFLGKSGARIGRPLKALENYFEQNRASTSKSTIQVSLAGAANIKFKAILHTMSVEQWNNDMNSINFVLHGLILPTEKGSK